MTCLIVKVTVVHFIHQITENAMEHKMAAPDGPPNIKSSKPVEVQKDPRFAMVGKLEKNKPEKYDYIVSNNGLCKQTLGNDFLNKCSLVSICQSVRSSENLQDQHKLNEPVGERRLILNHCVVFAIAFVISKSQSFIVTKLL